MSLTNDTASRRCVTIPALFLAAILLVLTLALWIPIAVILDAVRGKFRLPLARLLGFATCWAWLEVCGVTAAFALWLTGQARNRRAHYALQRWWAKNMLAVLGPLCGIRVDAQNAQAMQPGPALLFVRHASLADSLVSAYVVGSLAGLEPRYVLKKELLIDPCLDVVGQRIPNYFLDRGANDSAPELAAIRELVSDLGPQDIGIIFPEGTRSNPAKRASALAKIAAKDPARGEELQALQHLLPPRPSGAAAMRAGAPNVDIVLAWHVGFEGLDTFGGILQALGRRIEPIRFVAHRVPSSEIPSAEISEGRAFADWLDQQWLALDNEVGTALLARS